MITNLEIVDDDTAKAFGQKFDVERVLEATIAFLKAFTARLEAADAGIRASIRFPGDGDRSAPLDEDAFARLRRETILIGRTWDVDAACSRVDAGPFRMRLYLRGRDALQRYGGGEPFLITEASWRDLDPTPVFDFTPVAGMPIFGPKALALVKGLIVAHAPEGVKTDFGITPNLRFPHRAFGAGLGDLRISLLTVPVEP